MAAARQVMEAEQALAAKTAERSKLLTQKASLEPWSCLDVPLNTEGTATVPVHFCSVPGKTDFAALEAAVSGRAATGSCNTSCSSVTAPP